MNQVPPAPPKGLAGKGLARLSVYVVCQPAPTAFMPLTKLLSRPSARQLDEYETVVFSEPCQPLSVSNSMASAWPAQIEATAATISFCRVDARGVTLLCFIRLSPGFSVRGGTAYKINCLATFTCCKYPRAGVPINACVFRQNGPVMLCWVSANAFRVGLRLPSVSLHVVFICNYGLQFLASEQLGLSEFRKFHNSLRCVARGSGVDRGLRKR